MTNLERLQESREILKSLTVERLQTPEGQEEFNQAAGEYIRDRIRNTSLFYKVIPPQPVIEDQLENYATGEQPDLRCLMPSVQLFMPEPITAMLMDMCAEPVPKYIYDKPQLPIPMRTVKTKRFEKTTEELSAFGILKVVEEMASWEAKERDRKFLKYCGLAVERPKQEPVERSKQEFTCDGPLQRSHLIDIKKRSLMNGTNPKIVLLSKIAFIDLGIEDSATKISDMTCIPSTKKELFDTWDNGKPASIIWSFPAPESLGYNLYCGSYKVWSQWERMDLWSFQGWEMVGAGIGNINGITKLTIASSRRLGFMAGEINVPDDFDSMGGPEIEKMFGGG